MFISKLDNWFDEVDPYAIQRVALGKALFIATVLVLVYWIFKPMSFSAFIMPTIIVYYYENTTIRTRKEKEQLIVFIFTAFVIGNISFYLIYPFPILFFYYAIFFFAVVYYLFGIYYNQLKSAAMVILAYSLFTLSDKPPANFQMVYNLLISSLLSIIPMLICLRLYPNRALIIWSHAMQKFLACMEEDIEVAMQKQKRRHFSAEVQHLSIVRAFRKLVARSEIKHTYRISINIRNIQFALNNISFDILNEPFWRRIQQSFMQLRTNMRLQVACSKPTDLVSETPLQHYVTRCLNQAIDHWNQLCCIQKN